MGPDLQRVELERYKKIVELANEGIWTIDASGLTDFINERGAAILGYTPEEMLGRPLSDFVLPEDRKKVERPPISIAEGTPGRIEVKMPRKNGTMVWLLVSTSPILGEDGSFRGALAMAMDITDLKSAEEKLRDQKDTAERYLEIVRSIIIVLDVQGNIVLLNREGYETLGYAAGELYGRNWLGACVPPEERDEARDILLPSDGRTPAPDHLETTILTKKGERRIMHWHSTFLRDDRGHVTGTLISGEDVTDRKRAEAEREAAVEFLRIINESHDTEELIHRVILYFQATSYCEAIGVRLKVGEDFPYYETRGFPECFVRSERLLCSYDREGCIERDHTGNPVLECMCGNVIRGRFDVTKPFFTPYGSFWTNSTSALLASTTEEDRQSRTRNRCHGEGYESVALIPLEVRGERLGLLQVNDRRKGMLSPEIVAFWERLAGYLAVALSKFRSEEELKESEVKHRTMIDSVQELLFMGSFVRDRKGNIVDFVVEETNPVASRVMQTAPFPGGMRRKGSEMVPPDMLEFYIRMIKQTLRNDCPTVFNYHSPLTDRDVVTTIVINDDKAIISQRDITDIKQAQLRAEEQRARMQAILDIAPVGIFIGDRNGKAILMNKAFYTIWGANAPMPESAEAYGAFKGWFPGSGREIRAEDWAAARALKGETVSFTADILRFDGRWGTIITSAVPLRGPDGEVNGVVNATQDITGLRKVEDELKRSNAELQEFAYVASHDLQEPLRMVTSYLDLLEHRYGPGIDPKAREYMDFAMDGAERMRALVNDLLAYSRVNTSNKKYTPVDMSKVVEETLKRLDTSISEAGAVVTVDPLPEITADRSQMIQVFQNLLSNAIKFRGIAAPRIRVSAKDKGKDWEFAVEDNGVGIDPRFYEKLFNMFQRFHTHDEYPGTGMGLAIAKKIVERHGGRIWAVSDVGEGSTFYFTIPKAR